MSASYHRYLSLFSVFLCLAPCSSHLGPLQATRRLVEVETPHYDDPSCVWFTLQDQLPAETVQLITYGAPEVSVYLAMGLMGRREQTRPLTKLYKLSRRSENFPPARPGGDDPLRSLPGRLHLHRVLQAVRDTFLLHLRSWGGHHRL